VIGSDSSSANRKAQSDSSAGVQHPAVGSRAITSKLLRALSHETRRDVLRLCIRWDGTPASPREISEELHRTLNHVAHHVRVLARNDALVLVDTKKTRGSTQHFYVPSPEVLGPPVASDATFGL
jgi:hypothetical protein